MGRIFRVDDGTRRQRMSADGAAVGAGRAALTALATVIASAVLVGCAAKPPPPPKPTEIIGVVQAMPNVNPSVSKRPSPLLIRIYELKTATAFNSADFVSLYQRDQAELGAEMVTRDEIILNPGDTRPWNRTAAPETRFIGVFAAYRDLDRAKWRGVVALQPNQQQRLEIRAGEAAVQVTVTLLGPTLLGPTLPAQPLLAPVIQVPLIPLPPLPKAGAKQAPAAR